MSKLAERKSIYEALKATGAPMDSHESDLYVKKTPETEKIIKTYKYRDNVTTFSNQLNGGIWYDVPFAYQPWWDSRAAGKFEE